MAEANIVLLMHGLVDGWCQRRALTPLAIMLPAYLAFDGLSDGWHALWRAVNELHGLRPDILTGDERAAVAQVRALIYEAFATVGRTAELDRPTA